jgi:uncharacterized protein (TIGR03663 family)
MCGVHRLADAEEWHFRLVPVIFSLAGIVLLWRWQRAMGPLACFLAGLFVALSPVQTYYARYFIQESLFVFFSFAVLLSGYAYLRQPASWRALLFGVSLGLLHATKETSVLVVGSVVVALMLFGWKELIQLKLPLSRHWIRHAAWGLGGGMAVIIVLFSAFFSHGRGPLDAFLTYASYFTRAEGAGSAALHDKPWYYYFALLFHTHRMAGPHWSEAPFLLLGFVGMGMGLLQRGLPRNVDAHFLRFFAIYTLLLCSVYSVIPYKTPWNLLPFYSALLLLAGVGTAGLLEGLLRMQRPLLRWGGTALLVAFLGWSLLWMARLNWASNHTYAADVRNPYVYAHTSTALMRLVDRVQQIASVSPGGRLGPVYIIKPDGDYWPLPWYLRKQDRVGYWQHLPQLSEVPFIIADIRLQQELDARLDGGYHMEMHALRPDVKLLACIRKDLWDAFMATRR